MRSHFLQKNFLFFLVHNSAFFENVIKNYCMRTQFLVKAKAQHQSTAAVAVAPLVAHIKTACSSSVGPVA